jgi:hypothetical protein
MDGLVKNQKTNHKKQIPNKFKTNEKKQIQIVLNWKIRQKNMIWKKERLCLQRGLETSA